MTAVAPHRPARAAAVGRQDEQIQQNVQRIEEQKRRPSALAMMAARLGVSEGNLTNTLKSTVFKGCSDAEFVALVIVANEYNLNPLTKEIYAFSAKGGGIVPLVSVDGWVKIMNSHPQFDGIEFNDIPNENGKLIAIEAIVYRKDRSRPVRVTEYLDECKRNTDPWNKTPARMLRHRALIQGARYAFGFSGIYTEDDVEVVNNGAPVIAKNVTPPPARAHAGTALGYDPDTGEVDEETARTLDAQTYAAAEGRADEDYGDQHDGDQDHPFAAIARDLSARASRAETIIDLNAVSAALDQHRDAAPADLVEAVDQAINERAAALKGGK